MDNHTSLYYEFLSEMEISKAKLNIRLRLNLKTLEKYVQTSILDTKFENIAYLLDKDKSTKIEESTPASTNMKMSLMQKEGVPDGLNEKL